MRITTSHRAKGLRIGAAVGFGMAIFTGVAWMALAATTTVSQRNRIFEPNRLEATRGDTVRVVNDDGELIHHAYIATNEFNFDSGEQQPGSAVSILFTKTGTFTVRCRIHPKMALVVTVK
jgi:plastocyanin